MTATRPLELDPERYAERKAAAEYRLNVVVDPAFRLAGFLLILIAVWLHNRFVFPAHSAAVPSIGLAALLLAAYPVVAWLAVRVLYGRWRGIAFSLLFADIAMMLVAIYATGSERSLLFFIPLFRVVDQVHTSVRRAFLFGHAAIAGYVLLIAFASVAEGRSVSWPAEFVKIAILYGGILYTALTARSAELARRRTSSAVALLRQTSAEAEAKSRELERSEQQLSSAVRANELILQSVGEGIVGFDLEGRITMVNSRAAKTIGFSPSELIGKRGHSLAVHTRDDGALCDGSDCTLERALLSGREDRGENAGFIGRDGARIPVEYTSAPIVENGRLTGAVFSFRDITERKRMQAELIAARNEAERASRAKSQFLANMSHELRTPLNAIIGYSEMLQDEAQDSGAEEMIPDLQKINTAGKNLLGMLTDVLDIAKIEAGRMPLAIEPVNVAMLLGEIEQTIAPLCAAKSNRLTVVPADRSLEITTDASKLRRVLLALASNANKFTDAGELTLSASAGRDGVAFHVRDTGIGIEPAAMQTIFGTFSQADGTSTRKHGGSGLGLAISRRLADMLGGAISVESEPGRGSCFTLTLPASISPAPPTDVPHADGALMDQELRAAARLHPRGAHDV